MSDKKIPGAVFLIIGAGMVLMSVFIDVNKLSFFIFVGAVFVVIGFFKILLKLKNEAPSAHHPAHPHPAQGQHHPAQHAQHPQHAAHHASHPQQAKRAQHQSQHQAHHTSVMRCSSCGVKLHPLFKFCPNCGQKLK